VIFHSYGLPEGVLDLKSQKPMVSWEQMMISGYFYGGLLGLKNCVILGGDWNFDGISAAFLWDFNGLTEWQLTVER